MATLYCDFENGNDNYAGSSFALLAQGTNGRITTATFSSSGASFPNDGSLIGQYLSIFNGSIYAVYNITGWVSSTSLTIAAISGGTALANQSSDRQYYIGGRWKNLTTGATAVRTIPGDTIRITGSPEPTSLGQNGVWTSQGLQPTKIITSSTNTTPITISCTAHGYSTGDIVVITGHLVNTSSNGTWEITVTGANTFTLNGSVGNGVGTTSGTARLRNNTRVMLTTPVTQNIASTGPRTAAWSASTNATGERLVGSTDFKQHGIVDRLSVNSAFTTGLAFWYPTGTLDLSGYQQVSFWIRQQSGTIGAAGSIDLRLCSDTAGATAVNTINIPNLVVTGRWMPVTVDLGTNLGSSIQSIALYINTDNGAQQWVLANIIACKASSAPDSLTLTSLIGKNTAGETFWGIQSIDGRLVMLDSDTNSTPASTTLRGYYGTSETVTTWKRETIKLGPAAASTTTLQTIQESGTDGSPITYSGGWDRTNMSTQNLETWLDGVNGNGYGIVESLSYININKIAFTRFNRGFSSTGSGGSVYSFIAANNCSNGLFFTSRSSITVDCAVANNSNGLSNSEPTAFRPATATINYLVGSNGVSGIEFQYCAYGSTIKSGATRALIANNATQGITARAFCNLERINLEKNGAGVILTNNSAYNYGINCIFDDTTEIISPVSDTGGQFFSHNHNNTPGNHKIFMQGALISSATDQRKTASGISWKIQPTSINRSSAWPVTLSLAKVACAANSLVTIKAWMRRDNAGLTVRLVCKGGQIAGVDSDVTSSVTTTNAWEEETITFTPTETGVVEITAEAWGGTTFSGWVDDLTISQA